ncbi:MAG: hypothetical protein ACJA1Z_000591 [Patiriisocius sp.]|jgi:hypothetical protein
MGIGTSFQYRISLFTYSLIQKIISDEVYKQQLKVSISENPDLLVCGFCRTPVHFSEHYSLGVYFKHRSSGQNLKIKEIHKECPFHTGDEKHPLLSQIYSGEGHWHFTTKHLIAEILGNDTSCVNSSVKVEKYIIDHVENTRRCPDIYFEDKTNRKWAIELTNHWMNPTIAVKRASFFKSQNINVIWLLSPKCSLHQDSMFRFTLFGLSGEPNDSNEMSSHFNGFAMDDDAIKSSKSSKLFQVTALIPSFSLNKFEEKIDYCIQDETVHYFDLQNSLDSNVPFLKHQGKNYVEIRNKLDLYIDDEQRRKGEYELAEAHKKEKKRLALIQDEVIKLHKEHEESKRLKEAKVKESELAKVGYDKFCNELLINIENIKKNNFDNLSILNALEESYDLGDYLNDKVDRIKNLNLKHGFFNEPVLIALSGLREHVDNLTNRYQTIFNETQSQIIDKKLSQINILSQPFSFKEVYKPTLELALKMLENLPTELNSGFSQQLEMKLSQQIRKFSISVAEEIENMAKDSLMHAPLPSHIYKLIGADNLLCTTHFRNLNSFHQQDLAMLKKLYFKLSKSKF